MLEKGWITMNVRALFHGRVHSTPSRTPSGRDEAFGFHSGDGDGAVKCPASGRAPPVRRHAVHCCPPLHAVRCGTLEGDTGSPDE